MPRRGYRKGVSDAKTARPHVIKSRTSTETYQKLHADASSRNLTFSGLVAEVLDSHVTGERLKIPHARGPSKEALRELARLGVNLNQIAYHANVHRLHLLHADARACIARLNDVARQLAP